MFQYLNYLLFYYLPSRGSKDYAEILYIWNNLNVAIIIAIWKKVFIFVGSKIMLKRLRYTIGFHSELVLGQSAPMTIGIIDADLLDHGTRHPNLALLKISGFCKTKGHNVRLICDYSELSKECQDNSDM